MANLRGGTSVGGYQVATKSIVHDVTISTGWSGSSAPFSITLSVGGVTPSSNVEVLPSASVTATQVKAMAEAQIVTGTTGNGTITLKAFGKKPTISLPVTIIVRGD